MPEFFESTAVDEPIVRPSVRRRVRDAARAKTQPPYAVIVHNDDDHSFDYVIEMLQRVCGQPLERATELTAQVHYSGQALVWSGSREVAELKRDQMLGFGPDFYASQTVRYPIGVTIEPLPE